tara:strand:- start:17 stop:829 length:813 start_codon:yes stop_codon:yes gene_type:complete
MAGYSVSTVTTGKYARQVSVAASGPQGAQGTPGLTGATGAKGDAGATGGLSADFKFLNSYSADSPGSGYFAFNSISIFAATKMYISEYDSSAASQSALLDVAVASTSSNKSVMTVQRLSDGKFSRYYITEQSQGAGWRTLDIDYIDGSAFIGWTYNDLLSIIVTPVGDIGETGPIGPTGAVGPGVPSGGTDGQVLKKVGPNDYDTEWVDPSIDASAISNLVDVELTGVGNAQVLVYDTVTSRWVNRSTTEVPVSASQISGTIIGGSASTF